MALFGGSFGTINNAGLSSNEINVNSIEQTNKNFNNTNNLGGLAWVILTSEELAKTQRYITIQCRPYLLEKSNTTAFEYDKHNHYFKYQINNGEVQSIITRSGYDFSANENANVRNYLKMNTAAVFYDSNDAVYPEYIEFNVLYNNDGTPQNTKIGFYANFTNNNNFGEWSVGSPCSTEFVPIDITSQIPNIDPLVTSQLKLNGKTIEEIKLNGKTVNVMLNGKILL